MLRSSKRYIALLDRGYSREMLCEEYREEVLDLWGKGHSKSEIAYDALGISITIVDGIVRAAKQQGGDLRILKRLDLSRQRRQRVQARKRARYFEVWLPS